MEGLLFWAGSAASLTAISSTKEPPPMLITSIGSRAFDAALSLVYPQACAVCGAGVESRHDGVVCADCWHNTRFFQEAEVLCWKCGAPVAAEVGAGGRPSPQCSRCEGEAFTLARAGGSYEGALRASIIELKRRPHLPQRIVRLMHELQQREPLCRADLIIPVPLHPERERERGFNQALTLASEISRLSRIPLDEHSLVRRVQTQMHRAGMDRKARRKSVAGAFAVRHADLITGKSVLLIDDVFTTGATASACAAALCDRGAVSVFVLTIARA